MYLVGLGPRGHSSYSKSVILNTKFSWIEDDAIWMFLYRKIHNPYTKRVEKELIDPQDLNTWEKFRHESGSLRPKDMLRYYFTDELAPNIHNAFLTCETKIKLMFGLNIPIELSFLAILRREAQVEVDSFGRITMFSQGCDGGFRLQQNTFNGSLEDANMWQFLIDRIHDPKTGEVLKPHMVPGDLTLWREYKEKNMSPKAVGNLYRHFREVMIPTMHETGLDISTKAKLSFVFSIPMNQEFLRKLRDIADVNVDESRRLIYYKEWISGLEFMKENMPKKRLPFTVEEETEMYEYVYENIRDPKTGRIKRDNSAVTTKFFWKEFSVRNYERRDPNTYFKRFKDIMITTIHLTTIPRVMNMAIHFALGIPVHEDLLKELKKDAIVELDEKDCIIAYRERHKRIHSETSTEDCYEIIEIDNEEPSVKVPKEQEENEKEIEIFTPEGDHIASEPPNDILLSVASIQEIINEIIHQIEELDSY